jgi:predicted amidohydrolase
MTQSFKVACVQFCADDDERANIAESTELVRAAAAEGAELICLPEYFARIATDDQALLEGAHSEDSHPALPHFRGLARELDSWLLLGSLAIKIAPDKVNNRSYLLNSSGDIVVTYNKAHLFDVTLRSGESYHESATVQPGEERVIADLPWGRIGLTICYDVRFAYLHRALAQAGAQFLTIPAAFTHTTGKAHWHILVRARAIETGSYVFAPDQSGIRQTGRATYGHSLIVDPWGDVLADGGEAPGFIIADIDPGEVAKARSRIPALRHDRQLRG